MAQNHVVTVIADPSKEALSPALVTELQKCLKKRLATGINRIVLSEGEASDFFFASAEPQAVRIELKHFFSGKPFDWALLPLDYRRKSLLVSDMDSTMIGQECIDEIADFAGLKEKVAAITEAAMNGALDFKTALIERVALLKGIEEAVLERVYAERIRFTPGARTLVATMKAHGGRSLLVSGGFTFFTERVASALGFDGQMANRLGIREGKLSGEVIPPILDKDSKEMILRRSAEKLGLPKPLILAVGDGANDLPMLKAAGLGVAYRAKERVRKEAGVAIDHGDLTALLFLQGYKRAEFAA